MLEFSDIELLEDFRENKERGFPALFHRYYSRLVIFGFQIIGNEAQSQEIASDALFLVYKKHQDFITVNQLSSFLYLVVRNDCIDYLRYLNKFTANYHAYAEGNLDETDMLNIELDGALLQKLYNSIENLPDRSRQVIQYLFVEQLSYQKVAERMETTIKNIENIRAYALKRLKKDLNDSGSPVLAAILLMLFTYS